MPSCGLSMPRRSTSVSCKRLLRNRRPFRRLWPCSTGRRTRERCNASVSKIMLLRNGICSSRGGSRRMVLRRPWPIRHSTLTGKETRISSPTMRPSDSSNSRQDQLIASAIRTCFRLPSNVSSKSQRLRMPNVMPAVKKCGNYNNSTRNRRAERMNMKKCTSLLSTLRTKRSGQSRSNSGAERTKRALTCSRTSTRTAKQTSNSKRS